MFPLRPVFTRNADPLSSVQGAGNDSTAGAETNGVLTLEMRDNPFASLMRKLDRLLDLDPAGAFHLARVALAERLFDGKMEEKLRLRMAEIVETIWKNGPEAGLGSAFMKSALHLVADATPMPTVFTSPALAFTPFGIR